MVYRFKIIPNDIFLMGAVLLLLALGGCGDTVRSVAGTEKLVILHFNDTHSQVLPFKDASGGLMGGVSRRHELVRLMRSQNSNVIVVQAGDILTGSVFSSIFTGSLDIEFMNGWGQTLSAVGNHEFDYGLENAIDLKTKAFFPFIAANIFYRVNKSPVFDAFFVTNIAGARLVFVGLSTSDEGVYNRNAVGEFVLSNEFAVLSNLLYQKRVKHSGDILFLVTHVGFDRDRELARVFPEVDFIIGGHSHTKVPVPVKEGNALVMQTGQWGENVGTLELFLKNGAVVSNSYALVPVDSNVPSNKELDARISEVQATVKEKMEVKVCESKIFLDASEVRTKSMPIGNLVADITAFSAQTPYALVNAGNIRANLPSGTVKLVDIFNCCPFDNQVVRFDVKGSVLREVVRKGVLNRGKGGFLYFSAPFQVRVKGIGTNAVVEALVDGQPIDDSRTYTIATLDFLYRGGDGYGEFSSSTNYVNTYLNLRDTIVSWLKKKGVLDAGPAWTNARVTWQ